MAAGVLDPGVLQCAAPFGRCDFTDFDEQLIRNIDDLLAQIVAGSQQLQ
jgi:hypothetical protein